MVISYIDYIYDNIIWVWRYFKRFEVKFLKIIKLWLKPNYKVAFILYTSGIYKQSN